MVFLGRADDHCNIVPPPPEFWVNDHAPSCDWTDWQRVHKGGIGSWVRWFVTNGEISFAHMLFLDHLRYDRSLQCHTYNGQTYHYCREQALNRGQDPVASWMA